MVKFKKWIVPLVILSMAEVLAGITLRINVDLLVSYPVLLILTPGLMDLRGNVYGAIGYRLAKALHLGLTSPRIFTKFNLMNTLVGYVISVAATVLLCLMGLCFSFAIGLKAPDAVSLLFIALVSTLLVFVTLTPITTLAIIYLFKHGRDPSSFVATLVTGIGDFLTPATFLAMSYLHEAYTVSSKALFSLIVVLASLGLAAYIARTGEKKNLVENFSSSIIGSAGSSIGGLFLAMAVYIVSENPEIVGILPAFNAVIGAAMGYLGNKLNIDLHIGADKPARSFYTESATGFLATYTSIIGSLVLVIAPFTTEFARLLRVVSAVSTACLAVYLISSTITYFLTIFTFRNGWDPDNVVFPVMTTFVDLTGPVALSTIGRFLL